MKKLATTFASLALLAACAQPAQADTTYKFKKGQLVKVSGKQCGLIANKWKPVKKSGKAYVVDKKGGRRCSTLLAPSSLKKSGLASIPSAAGLLKSSSQTSALAVSGTPPAVKNIPTVGVKNVFWTPGLVDAINAANPPTQLQCSEFFHGTTDGQSAGMLGCYSVQGVAFAFQSILEGGSSACFMKNIPTRENVASGGVQVIDGSLPGGDITKLFSTPTGSKARVVKVVIGGMGAQNQYGFIRINSQASLDKKGQQYSYNLWFCNEGQTTANNYEETTVTLAGEYKYFNVFAEGTNEYQNEMTAYLTKTASGLEFDTARERVAQTTGEFQGANFKSLITVLPNNTITTKVKESFNGFGRSNYAVAEFSGSGVSDFSVKSAAIKDVFSNLSQEAGIEYRDTMYVSAPSTTLKSELTKVDIAADTFYSQPGSVTPDFSDKSCSQEADVTVQMNFLVPSMQLIALTCQAQQLQNMDFCRNAEVTTAFMKCQQP
jgi:hypothetical protein